MRDGFDDDLGPGYGEDVDDEGFGEDDLVEYRRPWWVTVVAAIIVVGLVIGAVPRFLWPWIVFFGFIAFLLWRAIGPRRPSSP